MADSGCFYESSIPSDVRFDLSILWIQNREADEREVRPAAGSSSFNTRMDGRID